MRDETRPGLSVRQYGAAPGRHAHDHFQVLWALDGRLELEVEGRGASLDAGQGHLLRPGERHDFEAPRGSRCLVLDSGDLLWAAAPARPRDVRAMHHLAAWLASGLDAGLPAAAALGPLLLAQTWAPPDGAPARARRPIDWPALAAWVEPRLAQPLGVADLALRVFLAESQLRERCHAELGMSPMQWLRALRLARARALRAAGLPVATVARRTGYASPSALTAALRRGDRGG